MRRSYPIVCFFALALVLVAASGHRLAAQSPKIRLDVNLGPSRLWQPGLTAPQRLFPDYVIQNPLGYSPLCRMELKIERQSPIGVWMKLDGNRSATYANPGWASLRFKVPLAGH